LEIKSLILLSSLFTISICIN